MCMSESQSWYYCTNHNTVEQGDGPCPGKDRLGPYATREEAEHALDTVHRRNEEWDKAD
jgi:hypothetical protein